MSTCILCSQYYSPIHVHTIISRSAYFISISRKSHTTKNITSNTDNPTMQSYYTSIDTSNSYLLRQTNYSTEDSDNALNFE
ncbi:hypothetical protein K1T71_010218 [Dendrolimus kikuchii]|uniref:Uncharacterized protein n=1 Tax=Dendrolimus kikuchii TaxID=765133 RepID=A0ACC1CS40_9NEOP|nr:hypothetical protein K1T71_010218 [Dendrolimus kikuchii]